MRIAILVFVQLILVAYAAPLDMITINSSTAVQSWAISKKSVNIEFVDPTTGKRRLPVSKSTIEPSVVRTWLRTAFTENYDFFDENWKTVFENGFNGSAVWRQDSNGVSTFKGIGNGLCYKNWCTMNVDQQGHGTVADLTCSLSSSEPPVLWVSCDGLIRLDLVMTRFKKPVINER
ncbi:hypothetical protein F5051DRAFT_46918 [Lentinula edodes]|nr:hypothetical protein F5051DRAFT_46918 [Lentinula edodes]